MAHSKGSSDLMKRLALVHCIASLYRVYERRYDMFLFNALAQLVSEIPEKDVEVLLNDIVMGKLNPAFFDLYEI